MANKKEVYVVGVLQNYEDRTGIKYVTGIPERNYAEWKAGETAMEFSKEYAKDIAFGLCFNNYTAIPILKEDYLDLKNCLVTRQTESEGNENV